MTFAITYLTVCERSLICGDLHPDNHFVARHFLRTPMQSNVQFFRLLLPFWILTF